MVRFDLSQKAKGGAMKKLLLLTVSVLLLFTACSPAQTSSRAELDLEKITDGVYIKYDRSRFENISAPKVYYAESITPDDSVMASFLSAPPRIYDDNNHHKFENGNEYGYYGSHGIVMYFASEFWPDLTNVYGHRYIYYEPSVEELDFMPLTELYERFENDVSKFLSKVVIYDMLAVTAEEFAEVSSQENPPIPERGWSEPKDFYYIRARQFVNDIPIFTGMANTNVDTLFHCGANIDAIYSEDGLEYLDICGYTVGEEAPTNGTFIDLSGAEQIIRDRHEMPIGYDDLVFIDVDLVYVGQFEGDRTILTPAWEFYVEIERSCSRITSNPWYRINAYTGEFIW